MLNPFAEWLNQQKIELEKISTSAQSDLAWVVKSVLGEFWSWSSPLQPNDKQNAELKSLVSRVLAGEPVAYVLGAWEFYGIPLEVGPGVLIPRPETELIVDLVKRDFVESEFVLGADFGSGSGCLAIAITRQLPDCQMKAVECSESAFPLLARNLETQGRGKVQMLECKVQELNGKIAESSLDMIVANPPYIAQGDTYVGEQVHKFEPHVALYSEDQGKKDIKDWLAVAKGKLKSGGRYYFEIGWRQEGFVTNLLKESEGWNLLEIVKDYSDHPRVVVCKRL